MHLLALPDELLYSILYHTSDPQSVFTFGQCSKEARACLQSVGVQAAKTILQEIYGADCTFLLRIVIESVKQAQNEFDYRPFWKELGAADLSTLYNNERAKGHNLSSTSVADIKEMVRFHGYIERFSRQYFDETLRQRSMELAKPLYLGGALSDCEKRRLRRALLHYEIFCRTLWAEVTIEGPDPLVPQWEIFTHCLPEWEKDEIFCVILYLEHWWAVVLGDFISPDAIDRLVARRCGEESAAVYKLRYDIMSVEPGWRVSSRHQQHSCDDSCNPLWHPNHHEIVRDVRSIPLVASMKKAEAVACGCATRGLAFYSRIKQLKHWADKQDFLDSWCLISIYDNYRSLSEMFEAATKDFSGIIRSNEQDDKVWTRSEIAADNGILDHDLHANLAWRWANGAPPPENVSEIVFEQASWEDPRRRRLDEIWQVQEGFEVPVGDIGFYCMSGGGLWLWDSARLVEWRVFECLPAKYCDGRLDAGDHIQTMIHNNKLLLQSDHTPGQSRYLRFRPPDAPEGVFYCQDQGSAHLSKSGELSERDSVP